MHEPRYAVEPVLFCTLVAAIPLLAVMCLGAPAPERLDPGLLATVLRLEVQAQDGGSPAVGTGFLVSTTGNASGKTLLITNKHVVGDWNYADRDFHRYYAWVDVFFYRSPNDPAGQAFRPGRIDLINVDRSLNTARVHLHPDRGIDLVAIDVTDKINNDAVEHIQSAVFDESFMLRFSDVRAWHVDITDEVIALGYPFGIRSLKDNYPIAKIGTLASTPGKEVSIPVLFKNRLNADVRTTLDGKFFVVDGLITFGNSGGPVTIVGGVRVGRDPKTNALQFTDRPVENRVIGVVSAGIGGGLSIVVSSDYVVELMHLADSKPETH
jgi:hypothetical protein